ncbi:hypothetical protein T484DRAFT_1788307 [Baffinella frigidus]|nr:hypothetical protein T484DRAFT_1788307 [Cryptophyta sp. CCMP2293]
MLSACARESCAQCGKHRATLKRCSRCKQASYCGALCQNAAWRGHKKSCVLLKDVWAKVSMASASDSEWREVLKWEGRMEDLMENVPDAACNAIIRMFKEAHRLGLRATGNAQHSHAMVALQERRIGLLGKMERFRDQGEAMCTCADSLHFAGKRQEAAAYFQRARNLAEAHGFFSVECLACMGLGELAIGEGRHEEGVALIRNALHSAELNEEDDNNYEINVLCCLCNVLLNSHAIDEVEPLLPRYLEAANAESTRRGRLCIEELRSLYASARFHEARGNPHDAVRDARGYPLGAAADVRSLLALLRLKENAATVEHMPAACEEVLREATLKLKILDQALGDEELVGAVAAEVAQLRALSCSV